MLKNINPLLSPDLLRCLRAMGHGDEIAIVDGNYPAETDAKRLIRMDGHDAPAILDAILSVMPVDDMVTSTGRPVRQEVMPDTCHPYASTRETPLNDLPKGSSQE